MLSLVHDQRFVALGLAEPAIFDPSAVLEGLPGELNAFCVEEHFFGRF
jgi:hypothetical protein